MKESTLHKAYGCMGVRLLRGIGVTSEFIPQKHEKPGMYGADPRWNLKRRMKKGKKFRAAKRDLDVFGYEGYDLI